MERMIGQTRQLKVENGDTVTLTVVEIKRNNDPFLYDWSMVVEYEAKHELCTGGTEYIGFDGEVLDFKL